jgi:hypothetical protein
MANYSEKIIKACKKAGIKGERVITLSLDEMLNSGRHNDIVEFLKRKKAFDENTRMDIVLDSAYQGCKNLVYYN